MNDDKMAAFRARFLDPKPPPRPTTPPPTNGTAGAYAQAALDAELERLVATHEGKRNNQLNIAGFNLAQLVAVGKLDHDATWKVLALAALSTGLTTKETNGTLRSSFDAGLAQPRVIGDREDDEPPETYEYEPPPEPEPDPELPTIGEQLPELNWSDFWADETHEEWLVRPLIPARRLVALFSPPKVGKSLLMLELAVGIATGSPVFGQPATEPRHVLYVDFENDPSGDLRPRLVAMGFGPHDDLSHLHYLSFPNLPALDTAMGGLLLASAAEWYGVDLVVIDTISRAVRGEENDNDTWLNFYRHTGVKLKAAGVACLRLDHTGKDETKGMRGGSAKAGDVDVVWFMRKVTDNVFTLDCLANRLPIPERYLTVTRHASPRLHHTTEVGPASAQDAEVAQIVNWLDALDVPTKDTQEQAVDMARSHGLYPGKFTKNNIERAVVQRRQRPVEYPDNDPSWNPSRSLDDNS